MARHKDLSPKRPTRVAQMSVSKDLSPERVHINSSVIKRTLTVFIVKNDRLSLIAVEVTHGVQARRSASEIVNTSHLCLSEASTHERSRHNPELLDLRET